MIVNFYPDFSWFSGSYTPNFRSRLHEPRSSDALELIWNFPPGEVPYPDVQKETKCVF